MKNLLFVLLTFFLVSCNMLWNPRTEFLFTPDKKLLSSLEKDITKSFIKIDVEISEVIRCTPEQLIVGCVEIKIPIRSAIGSGSVIRQNFNGILVLTAAHVCSPEDFNEAFKPVGNLSADTLSKNIYGTNFYGTITMLSIEKIDIENDVCILKSKSIWPFIPALNISNKPPKRGERIYMAASPHGIFSPGVVLFFEGYYSGVDSAGDAVYTIPVTSGSSGASVLNHKGHIVGIIHSGLSEMENVGFGSNWMITHEFVIPFP